MTREQGVAGQTEGHQHKNQQVNPEDAVLQKPGLPVGHLGDAQHEPKIASLRTKAAAGGVKGAEIGLQALPLVEQQRTDQQTDH